MRGGVKSRLTMAKALAYKASVFFVVNASAESPDKGMIVEIGTCGGRQLGDSPRDVLHLALVDPVVGPGRRELGEAPARLASAGQPGDQPS